jgi:hypothetical protein
VDFPAGYTLQPLTRLRHLTLDSARYFYADGLQELLSTAADSLESLSLPSPGYSHGEGLDLSSFTRLRHVMSRSALAGLCLPLGCRLHWGPVGLLDAPHCTASEGQAFKAQLSSLAVLGLSVGPSWAAEVLEDVALCSPEVDTLQVRMMWAASTGTLPVLELPASTWQMSALTKLTVLTFGCMAGGGVAEPLGGALTLTVPASLALRELVLHAKVLSLTFEDMHSSAGVLDSMRLIGDRLEGFPAGPMMKP